MEISRVALFLGYGVAVRRTPEVEWWNGGMNIESEASSGNQLNQGPILP